MHDTFFKKLVALTLAGCLALSCIPSVAFSDDTEGAQIETQTAAPTAEPTVEPTEEPTSAPTAEPTLPAHVLAVQQLIDALPAADALTAENLDAAYMQAQYAYCMLTEEERAAIIGAEKFELLFERFEQLAAAAQTFAITVDENIENGSVSADKTEASAGTIVTLTATPNDNYELAAFTVTNGTGTSVAVGMTSAASGTFVMPSGAVTVSASFAAMGTYYAIYDQRAIESGTEYATTSFSTTAAKEGELVTVTMVVKEGYSLKEGILELKSEAGGVVQVPADSYDAATNTNTCTFSMPAYNVLLGYDIICPVKVYLGETYVKTVEFSAFEDMDSGILWNTIVETVYVENIFIHYIYYRVKHEGESAYSAITTVASQPGDEVSVVFVAQEDNGKKKAYIFGDLTTAEYLAVEPTKSWRDNSTYTICSGSLKLSHKINGKDTVFTLRAGDSAEYNYRNTLAYALSKDGNSELVWFDADGTELNAYYHQPPLVSTSYTCYGYIYGTDGDIEGLTISGDDVKQVEYGKVYKIGTTVTLTLDPKKCSLGSLQGVHYPAEGDVTDDGIPYGIPFTRSTDSDGNDVYTFTMPADCVKITLGGSDVNRNSISVDDPALTVTDLDGKTIQSALQGENVIITIKEGYQDAITAIKLNGVDVLSEFTNGAYSFTMPNHSVSITTEKKMHSITLTTDDEVKEEDPFTDSGKTYYYKPSTITADKTQAAMGDTVTLSITPFYEYGDNDEKRFFGCKLAKLELNGVDVTDDVAFEGLFAYMPATYNTFTMPNEAVTVKATFEKWRNIQGYGTNGLEGSWALFAPGDKVTYRGVPYAGRKLNVEIERMVVAGSGTEIPVDFIYDAAKETYSFTVPLCGTASDKLTITCKAANNETINSISWQALTKPAVSQIRITAENGTVKATANNSTTVIDKTGTVSVDANSPVTLELVPTANATLEKLTVGGADVTGKVVNNVYRFTVNDSDVDVAAKFVRNAYTITIGDSTHGTVTADKNATSRAKPWS